MAEKWSKRLDNMGNSPMGNCAFVMSMIAVRFYQVAMVVSTKIAEITWAKRKIVASILMKLEKEFNGEWWNVNTSFSQIAQVKWSTSWRAWLYKTEIKKIDSVWLCRLIYRVV